MFDLHMHTNLSDGALSVEQLLERIKENNIQPFSITDHNHALAYDYIKEDIPYLIKGVELTTSFEGTIIEILGYHIEPYIINDWYHEFYSDTNLIANETMLFNDLKYLANQLGYPIPEHLEMETIVKGISKKTIYAYLKEHYPAYTFDTYKNFFRQGLSNPNSKWFIDEGRFYPSIDEVITLIHKAGGIAFLAHPYEYGFGNLDVLFNTLIDKGIDGIECFHPSAAMKQSIQLVEYCTTHNLLASGGSDFHRDERMIPFGVNAHQDILDKDCFSWIHQTE